MLVQHNFHTLMYINDRLEMTQANPSRKLYIILSMKFPQYLHIYHVVNNHAKYVENTLIADIGQMNLNRKTFLTYLLKSATKHICRWIFSVRILNSIFKIQNFYRRPV
mgnify:FL=1